MSRYDAYLRPCRTALDGSFDEGRQLFSYQLLGARWRRIDDIHPHETLTGSCIALIGAARDTGGDGVVIEGLDVDRCLYATRRELRRTGYLGGLGLVLWADAVAAEEPNPFRVAASASSGLADIGPLLAPALTTMEAAWLLSGLCHQFSRLGSAELESAAGTALDELRGRMVHETSLMRHTGERTPLARIRARGADFEDQIHSVQAFAFAALVLADADAASRSCRLAQRQCEMQGEMGEWYRRFDPERGRASRRYPLHSVYQHGLAPMAFAACRAATGLSFADSVNRSLEWIEHNESGYSMFDPGAGTIWRGLDRRTAAPSRTTRRLAERAGRADVHPGAVILNREARPSEWAWCLYAAAIDDNRAKDHAIV
ncbi:MAG: hypothetical protein R2698_03265 [Microthrixaceae bacterium]